MGDARTCWPWATESAAKATIALLAAFALMLSATLPSAAASAAKLPELATLTIEASPDGAPEPVAIALSAGPHYVAGAPMVMVSAPQYVDGSMPVSQHMARGGHMQPMAIDAIAPMADGSGAGARVDNLSPHAAAGLSSAREVQAVAVLLVVGAGCAALIGAFVLRRHLQEEVER